MLISSIQFFFSLCLLLWTADRLVSSASSSAAHLQLPNFIIGSTVVAIGTSAPEILVSISAALHGNTLVAVGNALGSNIANLLVIFFIGALVSNKVFLSSKEILYNATILLLLTISTIILFSILGLGYISSIILLIFFLGFLYYSTIHAKNNKTNNKPEYSFVKSIIYLAMSLVLLSISANYLVESAVAIARELQISEYIIGGTIVAIGTSLPEFITALVSTLKKQYNLAMGNIIGSNIFNNTVALGSAGIICPLEIPDYIIIRDLPILLGLTCLLFALLWRSKKMCS